MTATGKEPHNGDKGGKKDKNKGQKQKATKQEQEEKKKQDKQRRALRERNRTMADFEAMIRLHREFLKDSIRTKFDFARTDQNRGVRPPPVEKPYPPGR